MIWSKNIESIMSNGISLHKIGISNWALTKKQALDAIDKFESESVFVLGGDVYQLNNGVPEPNYDNWYCEREENESLEHYLNRCLNEARVYISHYVNPDKKQEFFALVAEQDSSKVST